MRQWYAFYPRDFMSDTMELSLEADALYRRLIDMYYINGGPFAKDVREICQRCRIDPRQFRRIFPEVEKYFYESEGLLHHNRIDAELEKAKKIQERRAAAGKKGGEARAKQMLDSESSKSLSKTQHNTTQHNKDISSATALHVEATKTDRVPYKEITDLYHTILGEELPRVASLSPARQAAIRARWKKGLPSLESWRKYFDHVSECDFLMGRCRPGPGRDKPFTANIDWLIKEANVLKVVEGRYDNG